MDTIKFNRQHVKVIAHRGVSGIEKENTCSAFVAAGNRSYFGIETDVHMTADNQFVIIHDDNTARVGIDNLEIEKSTFQTLRELQLTDTDGVRGRTDLRIPSLAEYVSICKKYEKVGVLELKNRIPTEGIKEIIRIIQGLDYLASIIFISFDRENMFDIRTLLPEQPAQFLTPAIDEAGLDLLAQYHLDLDIHYMGAYEELIRKAHDRGIKVNCWTVDTAKEAERLVGIGVDFITSNILE